MSKLALVFVCAVVFTATAAQAQQVGVYSRPGDGQASGVAGARTPFLRSPCPALNTLANHGYLPRDGRNISPQMLRNAVMQVYNVDFFTAQLQTSGLPFRLTLADLSQHNFIEHDMSLVHADNFYRQDPAQVDGGLANDLLGRANNGQLGITEVGQAIRARLIWCQQKRTGCDFKSSQATIAFREAALFLQVFGGKNGAKISAQHAYSFLVLEQFPADWRRPSSPVTLAELNQLSNTVRQATGV